MKRAILAIAEELANASPGSEKNGKLLEAQRINNGRNMTWK